LINNYKTNKHFSLLLDKSWT